MRKQLLFLEFNEINFDSVAFYCARGHLPNLNQLITKHGWSHTTSEQEYEHLEPWIQWVTAHTGLTFAEHGVFRLGDITSKDLAQVWEHLEDRGLRVGAISPINAKHRLRNAAFFVPDPWTDTAITGRRVLQSLYRAVSQAVNDNAQSKLTLSSALALSRGIARYASFNNYTRYASLALKAKSRAWCKAMFLDLLLADVFVSEAKASMPDFASLFLNAGAHIQHHYMFNSQAYQGAHRNPSWYAPEGTDPVREVYELYDHIVHMVRTSFPDARLMLATGLHQVPHGEVTYYWRLKEHARFLKKIGVEFVGVEPRMSRDFLATFADAAAARRAASRLTAAISSDGVPIFEVDNRGADLFVTLTFPKEIDRTFVFTIGEQRFEGMDEDVAFVALKNGEHSGIGYFVDTGAPKGHGPQEFPLSEIPQRISSALGVST